MEKVEQYIKEHINRYSNHVELAPYITGFTEWLTIDDARRVAEIAREETIKEVCEWLNNNVFRYVYREEEIGFPMYYTAECIEDLKKYLEGKK